MVRVLFGGTFDPVHDGHVEIVEQIISYCKSAFGHSEVVVDVMPYPVAPFGKSPESLDDRCEMLRIALLGVSQARVLRLDGSFRPKDCYEFLARSGENFDFVVIGSDYSDVMLSEVGIGLLVSKGSKLLKSVRPGFVGEGVKDCFVVKEPVRSVVISATGVRDGLKNGQKEISGLNPEVLDYIYEGGLYS